MPTGQSDGCLSTVWCQPRCVMVKTRPAQRNTDAGSISRSAHPRTRRAPCNGFHCTEAVCNAHWSIRRLSEHRMVPAEVCDGQDPTRST
jgi:hypothetical protein